MYSWIFLFTGIIDRHLIFRAYLSISHGTFLAQVNLLACRSLMVVACLSSTSKQKASGVFLVLLALKARCMSHHS